MARVNELIHKVSEVLTSVLITGESGTGKGVVARTIHDLGPRAKQPFVAFAVKGATKAKPGKGKLVATRGQVVEDWRATAALLRGQGQESLVREVEAFVGAMRAVATDKELLAKGLLAQLTAQRARDRAAERGPVVEDRPR